MNTLKINVPEGFEIDKGKSTFEEIVFKPIKKELPKKWEDLEKISGYYIDSQSNIINVNKIIMNFANENVFPIEEQAQAAIALAKLSQLREVYRGGWKPDWNNDNVKYCIYFTEGKVKALENYVTNAFLSFQTAEIRDEFLRNFRDLIDEASPLLFG